MCHSLANMFFFFFLTAPIFGQTKPTKLPLEVVSIVSKTGFGFSKINEVTVYCKFRLQRRTSSRSSKGIKSLIRYL